MAQRSKPRKPEKNQKPAAKKTPAQPDRHRRWIVRLGLVAVIGFVILIASNSLIPFFRRVENLILSGRDTMSGGMQARMPFPPMPAWPVSSSPVFDDFMGAEACAECHREQFDLWKQSTHGRAGGSANAETVMSPFNGKPIRLKDAVVTPAIDHNRNYTFIVEQTGFDKKVFRVDAVVGGGHLLGGGTQSYFSKFPDGTLRFLPFDFIREEKIWFGEARNRRGWIPLGPQLALTDLSEWPPTRVLGTEPDFTNCQGCHASQVEVKLDSLQRSYVTRYKSLRIDCEACHGAGRKHVELARSGQIAAAQDIGMPALATLDKEQALTACFQCHALKDAIAPGFLPGKKLQDYYSLKLQMLGENPYHPDGRVRAFGYQQNHRYSDCYLNGAMTCVDCHDPHAQTYRDVNGVRLPDRFDNGQCMGCHASKAAAPEKHSHHPANSSGNLCVSCHMPYLQHQAMGNRLRFARSDHSIPIPRPEFDTKLGIENACQKCHNDKSRAWQQTKVEEWYGAIKPHNRSVARLMQAQEAKDRKTASLLALEDAGSHALTQTAGLCHVIEKFLSPDMPVLEAEIIDKLKRLSDHPDIDVKALALMSLHFAQNQIDGVHGFLVGKLKDLGNDEIAVRTRWAKALAHLASAYRDRGDFNRALVTYNKALEIQPDDPATLLSLGMLYSDHGELEEAITCFQKALSSRPDHALTWVNLGIAHRRQAKPEHAIQAYRRALNLNPNLALAHFNLGNVYYEKGDFDNAVSAFGKTVELDPSLAVAHFFLARAYIKTSKLEQALRALRAGLQYAPEDENAKQMLLDLEAYLRGD